MKIGLFGKTFSEGFDQSIQQLISEFEKGSCSFFVYEPFVKFLKKRVRFSSPIITFNRYEDIAGKLDYLISIGGDGSLLNTIMLIKDSGIPILGINTGRLGFLAVAIQEHYPEPC